MIKLFFILFIGSSCFAQSFKDDLAKIVSKIESESDLSLKVKALVKTSENGQVIYESQSSILRRKNEGFLTKIDGEELLVTDEYEIVVSQSEKNIIVQKTIKLDEKDFSKKALGDIRKYFDQESKNSKIAMSEKLISENDGIRKYSIKNMPGISEMRMKLDMNSLKIINVEYWFKDNESSQSYYCLITYNTFDYHPTIAPKTISTLNYFTIDKDGNYVLAPRFNNYKLIKR